MTQLYTRPPPKVASDWNEFLAKAPATDDAMKYVKEDPMHIPLFDTIFSFSAPVNLILEPEPLQGRSRVSEPLDSVNRSRRRGVKRKHRDPAAKNSTQIISGPSSIILCCYNMSINF